MSLAKTLKLKPCKGCSEMFQPWSGFQTTCSQNCAIKYSRKKADALLAKQHRAEKAEGRAQLMTRSDWMKRAQAAFNAWVRLRDRNLPCVACGTAQAVQWHAGHYRTVKAAPELRFEPLNCWKQCSQCNNYMSGNLIEYRIELRKRIGDEKLAWLEGPHPAKKYTVEEIKGIEAEYKFRAKELKKE